ncbi:MAG: NUDIX domain-containing protein [Nanoarchaeota archaeon]
MSHIHEKIDFTVEVFIVYDNKVLLRMHDKYHFWLSVGGHIELDEDPNQAAIREVKEEVGLDVELIGKKENFQITDNFSELITPEFVNRHRINNNHEHITLVYFAKSKSDNIIEENEESKGYKWFSLEELDDSSFNLREHVKFYAKSALNKIKN